MIFRSIDNNGVWRCKLLCTSRDANAWKLDRMKKRILQREFGSPSQLRSAYLGGASEREEEEEEEEEADHQQQRHWLALGHVLSA